jgi:hypothetical protein
LLGCTATPVWAASDEIQIEAVGQLDYDFDSNITTATNKVRMVSGNMSVEADSLVYNENTGVANATGHVRLTNGETVITANRLVYNNMDGQAEASGTVTLHTKQGDFQTETIVYNSRTSAGRIAQFTGRVPGEERDYLITGQSATTDQVATEVSGATLTRCPLPHPEYQLSAKRIRVDDQKVRLEKVVLKVKGIPVFYFPSLTLNRNEKNLPRFGLNYDKDDGMKLNYEYSNPRSENWEWRFRGELTTQGDSKLDAGFQNFWGPFTHQMDLEYNTAGYFTLIDQMKYETETYAFTVDGVRDFSGQGTQKWGLSATRKYWQTDVGRWQLGLLARSIRTSETGQAIEGTYGGYRVDFNPASNMTFSLLHLADLNSTSQNQWVYLEDNYLRQDYDYQLGDNFIYDLSFPLNSRYRFGMDGVYNFNHFGTEKEGWIRQVYSISHETCCLSTSLGWNAADHSLEMRWRMRF